MLLAGKKKKKLLEVTKLESNSQIVNPSSLAPECMFSPPCYRACNSYIRDIRKSINRLPPFSSEN